MHAGLERLPADKRWIYEFLSFRSVVDPSQRENLGIIVQYKVKVKLCLGALGG